SGDGDEYLADRSTLDGGVGGRGLLEGIAVQGETGLLAGPEGAVRDCLVDVRGAGGDPVPADGVEHDELVARVQPHISPYVEIDRDATVVRVDRDRPARAENCQIELRVGAGRDLHD